MDFCMKWLRTLKTFQIFKVKIEKSKTYMGLMSFPRPIQMYHSHSDLIWPDHTLKKFKTKIILMYCTLKHSLPC